MAAEIAIAAVGVTLAGIQVAAVIDNYAQKRRSPYARLNRKIASLVDAVSLEGANSLANSSTQFAIYIQQVQRQNGTMAPFAYQPLRPQELRILELSSGSPEDPLSGTLVHRKLSPEDSEVPEFEALSYCWGDQSQLEPITLTTRHSSEELLPTGSLESGDIGIGPNLAAALRSLRYPSEKRILWCDSICINQKDRDERSSQVQRMYLVYTFALRVVVWLGPATSWSDLFMDTLQQVGTHVKSGHWDEVRGTFVFAFNTVTTAGSPVTSDPDPGVLRREQWHALESFLALDWHRRLWTYQEIILANQEASIVRIGGREILWTRLKCLVTYTCYLELLGEWFVDVNRFRDNWELFLRKVIACQIPWTKNGYSCIPLLDTTKQYQCSDFRDKVFALRGLLKPAVAERMMVDYTKSAKEVFTLICLDQLHHELQLQFLNYCNMDKRPSWVADLDRPLTSLALSCDSAARSCTSALLVEPDILEVPGVFCDQVSCDPYLLSKGNSSTSKKEHIDVFLDMIQYLVGSDLVLEGKCLDRFIMMIMSGALWDFDQQRFDPPGKRRLKSLQDWQTRIRDWMSGIFNDDNPKVPWRESDSAYLRSIVPVEPAIGCCRTSSGSFARVPAASRAGDVIVVLLGLCNPLVLRPQETPGYFHVVGPCYHPDFANSEALLGDDFHGWGYVWNLVPSMLRFFKDGHPDRLTDPRLDDVPSSESFTEGTLEESGHECPIWIYKDPYGCTYETSFDPRMSENSLRSRGVPIERFRLI
ncbi:heterokaryon incompatibility het-6 [Fusarium subglutinans]|uniref:Heterokaryon incompatibility het-6 n=1 Tax=Gibberella subglutinans TaxID=42677 RepID=A0A8H5V4J6_GIBSU|nr:heterokaryon incompatibility het-6 [Fusarium subglutinans]KAF5610727.1 heterokaryon incompatibility het-6 [Fusarium subglutinans]